MGRVEFQPPDHQGSSASFIFCHLTEPDSAEHTGSAMQMLVFMEEQNRQNARPKLLFAVVCIYKPIWTLRLSCCCSVTKLCPTLCYPTDCSTPGFPILHHSQSLLKLMCIESVMPSHHLILCWLLLLLPSIFPSIRVFSNESALHIRWPQLQHQHQPFQWIFRLDFLWDWLVWSPFSPRDSEESSPAPQFGSINSLVLSLLFHPYNSCIHT